MAYGDRPTPCDTCRPELKKFNEPYFQLYYYCRDQVIMGPMGPVGLNMLAIHQAMEDYNVAEDERIEFSMAVRSIANYIFSFQAEEAARKAKQK